MTRPDQRPASNSTARKRLEEREGRDHWEHPDAETRRLIQAAKAEAWDEGMAHESQHLDQFGQFCPGSPDGPCHTVHNPYRDAS